MSDRVSRRTLLGFLRPKAEVTEPTGSTPEPPAFSLDAFYAKRAAAPDAAPLPPFAVKAGDAPVETTSVGTGSRLARNPKARAAVRFEAARPGRRVEVVRSLCLAWQGSSCWTCSERCPVAGAIVLDAGRPTVDPVVCDGCARCVEACPAPQMALKFVAPTREEIA